MTLATQNGAVAQLGEHLLCKQGVTGSIPVSSTNLIRCLWIAVIYMAPIQRQADLFRQVS